MMALKVACAILAMALLASAAPHDSHEDHGESGESFEVVSDPIFEKVCPEGTEPCLEKLYSCFDQLIPATKEEREKEEKLWRETAKSCVKTLKKEAQGSAKNVSMLDIEKCTADKIYLTADGEVNKMLVKKQLELCSYSTTDVKDAVIAATDSCPTDKPDKFFGYYVCIIETCVDAM